ncbi:MAG: N-acetylmuramoyl-L-alanine amidase [Actinomycetota bacterium]|nr:N-acetylmuramoyl-L-alanine amidase [Actinomycetota bacterium]
MAAALGMVPVWLVAVLVAAGVAAPATSARTDSAMVEQAPATTRTVFTGVRIGIDPGHNGRNYTAPRFINHLVWNGRQMEACDTTGTQTNWGYTESRYTFAVARDLAALLRASGATVTMTRHSNTGIGPCIDRRAQILDRSHAAVSIDIHADGGPAGGRGFAVLEPVRDQVNRHVVGSSRAFGWMLRRAFLRTGMPTSSYDGRRGIALRSDLAGLNLTTMPKVLIECGNMRNRTDARMLTSGWFQHRAAAAIMDAMRAFLQSR